MISKVWFEKQKIFVQLKEGSIIGVSISNFPRLKSASDEQLNKYELWNDGKWIHWEELDEDLSASGFLKFKMVSV